MDDDKIRNIFENFQPELSSSFQFVDRLKKNMEAVEIIRQHNVAVKNRNRRAVAIAAVSGFAVGVIFTLLFPFIREWVSAIELSVPYLPVNIVSMGCSIIVLIVMATISVVTALTVYEFASAPRPYNIAATPEG